MQGRVRALFIKPFKGARPLAQDEVRVEAMGFAGDYHTGHSKRRQVLLMSGRILDDLGLEPGAISENVVVDGVDVMSLAEGQQLQIGPVRFEVTVPCEPCVQMDRVRHGLKQILVDRRGIFVRVIEPGSIRVGDTVSFG